MIIHDILYMVILMEKSNRVHRGIIKFFVILLLIIVLVWFGYTIYELSRVKSGNKPSVCFHEVVDTENINEYSRTCYGVFYKYREYYRLSDDEVTAKEFTLFFKEFKRKV